MWPLVLASDNFTFRDEMDNQMVGLYDENDDTKLADQELFEWLQKGTFGPEKRHSLLQKRLTSGKVKSSIFLIKCEKEERKVETQIQLTAQNNPSVLFFLDNEEVILECLEAFTPEALKHKSRNALHENLLHFFVRKDFYKATLKFLEKFQDTKDLLFEQSLAKDVPLMAILNHDLEDTAIDMWTMMKSVFGSSQFCLAQKNITGRNLLHLCAMEKKNKLLVNICQSEKLSKESIHKALNEKTPDGRTALDMCHDESTLLRILEQIDITKVNFNYQDTDKGKNILHHLAKRNFSEATKYLSLRLPIEEFRQLVFTQSISNNNNVLMTAATYGKDRALKCLLFFLASKNFMEDREKLATYNPTIDKILHTENNYGNTLLELALQHRDTMPVSINILLAMEKDYHFETSLELRDLRRCFYKYLNSSSDVLAVLQNIEMTMPKSFAQSALIWIQSFFKSFLVPAGLIALDIFTDVQLVSEYQGMEEEEIMNEWKMCTEDTEKAKFICEPLKLGQRARVFYSLGFILWPFMYYIAEFFNSTYFNKINKVKKKRTVLNII